MTITLSPQIEAKLLEKAQRQGQDPGALANDVLSEYLEVDLPEDQFLAVDIGEAIQAEYAKPIEQYIAEQRTKRGYPNSWPSSESVQETSPGHFVNTIEHD